MITLGQLKEIKDLRKVWPHEALDFTPWLVGPLSVNLTEDQILLYQKNHLKPTQKVRSGKTTREFVETSS